MSTTDDDKPRDFVEGALSTAFKWSGGPQADPNVATAFSLGWHVGQALTWAETEKAPADQLGLDDKLRWAALAGQIKGAHQKLTSGGGELPAGWEDGTPSAATKDAIATLRGVVMKNLYVVDSTLGKACLLGSTLHAMCARPSSVEAQTPSPAGAAGDGTRRGHVDEALQEDGDAIKRLLRDLASKLPANSAHAVLNSLSLWKAQATPEPTQPRRFERVRSRRPTADPADAAVCFRNQGYVWYSILAGEVAAKDLLRLSDYIGTGEEMVGRLGELVTRALRGKRVVLLALVCAVLFGVGIWLLLTWDGAGKIATGLATLIAAFGLTYKGIGGALGRAAAKGEQALWDAQIDWTIAYRCTIRVDAPGGPKSPRGRGVDQHVRIWQEWQTRWPDLSSGLASPPDG